MINKGEMFGEQNREIGLRTFPSASPSIRSARRGKHKIFIGMAPGVGKTYRMLEEAHALKREGIDVVIVLL